MATSQLLGSITRDFACNEVRTIDPDSPHSLADFEVVIWDPRDTYHECLMEPFEYKSIGNFVFHDSKIEQLDQGLANCRRKLEDFLGLGRIAVICPVAVPPLKSLNGKLYEGADQHLFWSTDDVEPMIGQNFTPHKSYEGSEFVSEITGHLEYQTAFKNPPSSPILFMRRTKKAIAYIEKRKAGTVIFLPPPINTPRTGNAPHDQAFVNGLFALIGSIQKTPEVADLPSWASTIVLEGESELKAQVAQVEGQLEDLEQELRTHKGELAQRESLKWLVAGNGTRLEAAVEQAMKILGFTAEDQSIGNRTDRVFWCDDKSLVMEIKGRDSKGAEASHLGQVNRWKSDFHDDHERFPDACILLVNGFRKTEISARSELTVFEPNIVHEAGRAQIGLITGHQLLELLNSVESGETTDKTARDQLLTFTGAWSWDST